MNKKLYIMLAFLLLGTTILFSACKQEPKKDEFWKATFQNSHQLATTEENKFVFDVNTTLQYSVAIINQFTNEHAENHLEYIEVKDSYNIMLKNMVIMFNTFYTTLELQPSSTSKNIKQYFTNFDKEIVTLNQEIIDFTNSKKSFENNITEENANTDFALVQLKSFKRAFGKLVTVASNFNDSFEKLYTNAYLNIPTKKIETAEQHLGSLFATVTINKLSRAYSAYLFDDSTNTINKNTNNSILLRVQDIQARLLAPADYEENTVQNLNSFILLSNAFDVELKEFYIALEKVNWFEYSNQTDQVKYVKEKDIEVYVNKIDSLVSSTANLITEQLLKKAI